MKLLFKYKKTNLFDIKTNGIQLIERDNFIEIYNDPFRTVPLFISRTIYNDLIIFSDFENLYKFKFVDMSIDEAGFWEIIFFGSALWTRTLYKNVYQMPAASCLKINKISNEFNIQRYDAYNVKENSSIKSIEDAADGMYKILDSIFASLDKSKKYLLGMSGGLDSRITLAFLSRHIPLDSIKLFTYGFDDKILEYKYAKEIAKSLGVLKPVFHKLTNSSYRESLDFLPVVSGGQISINHNHILDFFKHNSELELQHISTYFSDAVFGWDCVYPKYVVNIENNYYAETVRSNSQLSSSIKKSIIDDSMNIFSCFAHDSNFSSLDEFKYVSERNPKFHMFLASLQGKLINTRAIYANVDLLNYYLSVPIKFRQHKNLLDVILERHFKSISSMNIKNISSRFLWGSKYAGFLSWHMFRTLNAVNSIFRVLTYGKFQLTNKYQTEEHERLLYSEFRADLHLATSKLLKLGLLSSQQKAEFDSLPFRSNGVSERYALITLAKLV